jgi:hypothetical protein
MQTYNLIKDGEIVNSILAEKIEDLSFLSDEFTIEKLVPPEPDPNAEPAPEPTPPPRVWTQNDVRAGLTLAEKTKWDNDSAPEVKTAKIEIGFGLEEAAITEVLDFLVDASVISADSKAAVLA